MLLKHIATDIYQEENFNLGKNPVDNTVLQKPPFKEFREQLDMLTLLYKYDNSVAKKGTPL